MTVDSTFSDDDAGVPQPVAAAPIDNVSLDDCEAEPIHIPGHVQSHGVLLALDAELRVRHWSANAATILGRSPRLMQPFAALTQSPQVMEVVREVQAEAAQSGFAPLRMVEAEPGAPFDVLVHAYAGRIVVEYEQAAPGAEDTQAGFIARAHRVFDALRRQPDVERLMASAVEQVRKLSGFDRVMGYRFLHDDSGEVMAEARRDDLEALLGMRYPASDIPAQARRLYTLSTLRLIADVAAPPVPLLGHPDDAPLDMSHAALRSVSPIHVEYLRNMGVHASMSISIVVDGRLWGLIACHHYAPYRAAYAVRAVCDLLAQVVAARVARLEADAREALITLAAQVRDRVAAELQRHDDLLAGFEPVLPDLVTMFKAGAVLVTYGGRYVAHGDVDAPQAQAIIQSLPAEDTWVERDARGQWPAGAAAHVGPWIGMMAVAFDLHSAGWVLALRSEQAQTVRWAGAPGKHYQPGPRGPRLTPRGSFAEWQQTVHDVALPWTDAVRTAARHLVADLQRETLSRHADVERARMQMLAMLSHDLRDPLNTIRMAAGALERSTDGAVQQRIGARIRSSSGRMERLVAHLLDFSRIRAGRGLDVRPVEGDLVALVKDLIDETQVAHPGSTIVLDAPPVMSLQFDADRLAQAIGNLLSNARHHGDALQPVIVRLQLLPEGGTAVQVRNPAPPLSEAVATHLFQAFKQQRSDALPHSRHRGLGLGLFIAHRIAAEHGGRLAYSHEDGHVVFTIVLPG